jgi:hypothetical protein
MEINSKLTDHSESVDEIEKKLLEVSKKREKKKRQQENMPTIDIENEDVQDSLN